MLYELQGVIESVGALQSGVSSQSGKEWKKREIVVKTSDAYPKKVPFAIFGDLAMAAYYVGQYVTVSFDLDGHEYNGRWYLSAQARNVANLGGGTVQPAAPAVPSYQAPAVVNQPQPYQAPAPAPSPQQTMMNMYAHAAQNTPVPPAPVNDPNNDGLPF